MGDPVDVTREKLLGAAHDLLVERRGSEPSVAELCARAGVNVAMVSYCFGGKRALLDALLERTVVGVVSQLDALEALDLSPRETLRRHVGGVIENYLRYPYAVALGERLGDPDGRLAAGFAQPLLAFHTRLLARGEAAGEFRPGIDPALFFASLVGMCEFFFSARTWMEAATGSDVDAPLVARYTDHCAALLLEGVAAP